jgi:hypothetical protein
MRSSTCGGLSYFLGSLDFTSNSNVTNAKRMKPNIAGPCCEKEDLVIDTATEKRSPSNGNSLKFFYVGLAWAFCYPAAACLIAYTLAAANGNMA